MTTPEQRLIESLAVQVPVEVISIKVAAALRMGIEATDDGKGFQLRLQLFITEGCDELNLLISFVYAERNG